MPMPIQEEIERLVRGEHHEPHRLLGAHSEGGRVWVRAWRPDAREVSVLVDGSRAALDRVHPAGLFEGALPTGGGTAAPAGPAALLPAYRLEVSDGERVVTVDDPYRFPPTVGELDRHLLGEGRHERLWDRLGAHPTVLEGVAGTAFAVWAPNARSVRVVGDFNGWDGRLHPMRVLGSSGVWELFVPGVAAGTRYKYEVLTSDGALALKADPLAFATETPPASASVVFASGYRWDDEAWMAARAERQRVDSRVSDYVVDLGFTHIELMPVAEHPYDASWGYQVTSYFAPTARQGGPDDLRHLIDRLHQRGIGVLMDWVPAHFPKDAWALARFDGTALYEHADPRRGEHPDWGSLIFNYGRNEVRNFLLANALYWLGEFHVDGLRVDAVASMLYLDYSRKQGEWLPNRYGGNEDLDAVSFLREVNTAVYREHPGVLTVAEESTAWPAVSRPVYVGGLGFGFKWNMGWMHDTLEYVTKDPIYRRFHHHQLTFSLMYAFSENFVLPI